MPKVRKIRVAPGVAHRQVEGRTLVLVPADNSLMTLNASGAFLWQRLLGGSTAEALARALARRYRLPMARARQDVEAFLAVLGRRRLAVGL